MRRVGVRIAVPSLVLLQFCAGVVLAAETLDQADALAWLERIARVARQLNYSGTFVYQHGDQVETSRITHYFDRTGEYEKLETLDGPAREFIRNNDNVTCYLPDSKAVVVEKRTARQFPAFLPEVLGVRDWVPSPCVLGDDPQCLGKQSIGFTGELFGVNA